MLMSFYRQTYISERADLQEIIMPLPLSKNLFQLLENFNDFRLSLFSRSYDVLR